MMFNERNSGLSEIEAGTTASLCELRRPSVLLSVLFLNCAERPETETVTAWSDELGTRSWA